MPDALKNYTAYAYELWAGQPNSQVYAVSEDGELIKLTMSTERVHEIADQIDKGEQPAIGIGFLLPNKRAGGPK